MMNKIGAIFCLLTILLHIGCASTTLINSVPEGAKVTIDGEYAGITPYSYTDSKILGSSSIIELKKDGYKTKAVTIQKSDKPKISAIIGGFFLLIPWLWALEYKSSYTYELEKQDL